MFGRYDRGGAVRCASRIHSLWTIVAFSRGECAAARDKRFVSRAIFMSDSPRWGNGSLSAPTGAAGDRATSRAIGALIVTATGSAPTRAGIGSAMSLGLVLVSSWCQSSLFRLFRTALRPLAGHSALDFRLWSVTPCKGFVTAPTSRSPNGFKGCSGVTAPVYYIHSPVLQRPIFLTKPETEGLPRSKPFVTLRSVSLSASVTPQTARKNYAKPALSQVT